VDNPGWAVIPIALYFTGIGIWMFTEMRGIRSNRDRWPAFTDLIRALPLPLKIAVSASVAALGIWAGGHFLEFWP
jgi:hypothetical protein